MTEAQARVAMAEEVSTAYERLKITDAAELAEMDNFEYFAEYGGCGSVHRITKVTSYNSIPCPRVCGWQCSDVAP